MNDTDTNTDTNTSLTSRFYHFGYYGALITAWVAMSGSLYFSEVRHYVPCALCWYQRILMYPLALLLIVGLLRRDRHLAYLVLPFSLIGQGVSTYHYLI
ncbi:MAG: disulfide bond formation protein B, partial [Caldilineaceae bacterium]|nr:disulfide bond formation protein B [Caldilineaceae bacterium]